MSKKVILLPAVAVVASAATIAAGVIFLNKGKTEEANTNDYVVSQVSPDGESGSVDASLKYAGYVTLKNDEGVVELNFENPTRARKSLSLEIVAVVNGEEVILAETDEINPGYKITSAKYTAGQDIAPGKYDGKFVVHFYDEKDEEEIVNSEVEIVVYVK